MRKIVFFFTCATLLTLPCYAIEQQKNPLDVLPEEILPLILYEACDHTRDVPTVFTEMRVCKKWRNLLITSTTALDLKGYTDKSGQRHCTIMANMLVNPSFRYFSHTLTLTIDFHFENYWDIEFLEKLSDPAMRNFKTARNPDSIDSQITELKNVLDPFESEISSLIPLAKGPTTHTLIQVLLQSGDESVKALKLQAEANKKIWDERWDSYNRAYDKLSDLYQENFVYGKGDPNAEKHWTAARYLISYFLTGFKNLTTLNLVCWDQAELSFITQLKCLKSLSLTGHPGHAFDQRSVVYLDGMGTLKENHPLEELTLTGRLYIKDFQGWSKFPKLKTLTLSLKLFSSDQDDNEDDKLMSALQMTDLIHSLVTHIPQLEHMGFLYRIDPKMDVITPFKNLSSLTKLTFKDSIVTRDDLTAICEISSLKVLDVEEVVDSSWPLWRIHEHLTPGKLFTSLYEEEDKVIKKFSIQDLAYFRKSRPDIHILSKEEPQ